MWSRCGDRVLGCFGCIRQFLTVALLDEMVLMGLTIREFVMGQEEGLLFFMGTSRGAEMHYVNYVRIFVVIRKNRRNNRIRCPNTERSSLGNSR